MNPNLVRKVKLFLKIILTLCFLIIIFLTAGHYFSVSGADVNKDDEVYHIFVTDNGVHTSIVMPVISGEYDLHDYIPEEKLREENSRPYNYYAFGWGDKEFYMNTPDWSDLELSIALQAMLWPTQSVIKVSGYYILGEDEYTVKVNLSEEAYKILYDFLIDSFDKTEDGDLQYVAEGYGRRDAFFKARRKYHLFFTCNNWTAIGLRRAGLPTPLYPVFSSSIIHHLRANI
jgi:uncharacterized protein (TIGR02117 family)